MGSRSDKEKPSRIVAYVRVSTEKQVETGVSLEAQEAKLRAYAVAYEHTIVKVIVEAGQSAETLERKGLKEAQRMLDEGEADGLLVTKLDRLTRSVADLGRLLEETFTKHTLISMAEQIDTRTAGGRLVLNVLMSVSQWEREIIAERTSTALRYKRTKNEYTGGPHIPYGWERVGGALETLPSGKIQLKGAQLARHEGEQAIIALARELMVTARSLDDVAQRLEERGHLNRNGKRFHRMQISRMVTRTNDEKAA